MIRTVRGGGGLKPVSVVGSRPRASAFSSSGTQATRPSGTGDAGAGPSQPRAHLAPVSASPSAQLRSHPRARGAPVGALHGAEGLLTQQHYRRGGS